MHQLFVLLSAILSKSLICFWFHTCLTIMRLENFVAVCLSRILKAHVFSSDGCSLWIFKNICPRSFSVQDNQGPFISLMMAYIFNSMTHLAIDVRLMAFRFFDLVIQHHPSSFSLYAEKVGMYGFKSVTFGDIGGCFLVIFLVLRKETSVL